MQFIRVNNRYQTYFTTPDDQVSTNNAVRLIDAFIEKTDLQKSGFTGTIYKSEGRAPYAPVMLLKLFLYSYLNKIRSSRNIELQWLLPPWLVHLQSLKTLSSLDPGSRVYTSDGGKSRLHFSQNGFNNFQRGIQLIFER